MFERNYIYGSIVSPSNIWRLVGFVLWIFFFLMQRSTRLPLPTKIGWPEDGQIGLERMD